MNPGVAEDPLYHTAIWPALFWKTKSPTPSLLKSATLRVTATLNCDCVKFPLESVAVTVMVDEPPAFLIASTKRLLPLTVARTSPGFELVAENVTKDGPPGVAGKMGT